VWNVNFSPNLVSVKFNKTAILGLCTHSVSLAFVSESVNGKSMRIIHASTYDEYFWPENLLLNQNVGGDRYGMGYPATRRLVDLRYSNSRHRQTDKVVLAVTSSPAGCVALFLVYFSI